MNARPMASFNDVKVSSTVVQFSHTYVHMGCRYTCSYYTVYTPILRTICYIHVHIILMYIYMCFTENTIVVCSQDSEDVSVISKPLTTAVLHKIFAGLYYSIIQVHATASLVYVDVLRLRVYIVHDLCTCSQITGGESGHDLQ